MYFYANATLSGEKKTLVELNILEINLELTFRKQKFFTRVHQEIENELMMKNFSRVFMVIS